MFVVENDYVLGWLLWGIGSDKTLPGAVGVQGRDLPQEVLSQRPSVFPGSRLHRPEGWSRRACSGAPDTAAAAAAGERCLRTRLRRRRTPVGPPPGKELRPGAASTTPVRAVPACRPGSFWISAARNSSPWSRNGELCSMTTEKSFPRRRRCCAIRWLKYSRRRSAQWESGDARGISTTSSACSSDRRFGPTRRRSDRCWRGSARTKGFRFRTSNPSALQRRWPSSSPSGGTCWTDRWPWSLARRHVGRTPGLLPLAQQPVMKPTRPSSPGGGSSGDASRLNRPPTGRTGALRRSALRFGRNTPGPVLPVGAPPSRALSAGRLAPHRENSPLSALTRVPPPAVKPEKC